MTATEQQKKQIAEKVVESLSDTILEETEHYMFLTGLYDETDNNYIADQKEILKIIIKLLTQ